MDVSATVKSVPDQPAPTFSFADFKRMALAKADKEAALDAKANLDVRRMVNIVELALKRSFEQRGIPESSSVDVLVPLFHTDIDRAMRLVKLALETDGWRAKINYATPEQIHSVGLRQLIRDLYEDHEVAQHWGKASYFHLKVRIVQ